MVHRDLQFRLRMTFVALIVLTACSSPALAQSRQSLNMARERMVRVEILGAGVKNERVIQSMRITPRHEFVAPRDVANAYYDMSLPIGEKQTISAPFVVAYMTEQLDPQPTDKVLEIGTGSGYQAAILSPLVKEVYSIEIVESLGQKAARTLRRLGYHNIETKIGDGFLGWPEHAPFDKIIVTCSPENVPKPLVDQLKEGGRMVIPVGERYTQELYLLRKTNGKLEKEVLVPTMFVPMTGEAEQRRKVLPDPANPKLVNGSFEDLAGDSGEPVGWYYQRLMHVQEGDDAALGKKYVRFENETPGRGSRMLQAFALDGRQVHGLELALSIRGTLIAPGQSPDQLPIAAVVFYDRNRGIIGRDLIGPWRGTFDWQHVSGAIQVPPQTREAILHLGLFGATGRLDIDAVEVQTRRVNAEKPHEAAQPGGAR
jgi:protein-L-isoaspartate(D-aspartate) O-methyltransferase